MSQFMQLRVNVQPFYKNDFQGQFPNLARAMNRLDPELARGNPSLYALSDGLDKLVYKFDGTVLGKVLATHRKNILDALKTVQDHIADWQLSQADQALYKLEDIFITIESELDTLL